MTPSTSEQPDSITVVPTREDHRIAWLAALAITIHMAEAALPSPLPGIKPGLANLVTIISLVMYGWSTAAWITTLRVLAGSLLLGTFLSPTFMLSLGGAGASILVLWLATRLPGRGFGPLGYSLLAALAHMSGQVMLAYALFIPHPGLLRLVPLLLTAAVVFGLINGIISYMAIKYLKQQP
jgi:heptaprenyl diphosphate synthase